MAAVTVKNNINKYIKIKNICGVLSGLGPSSYKTYCALRGGGGGRWKGGGGVTYQVKQALNLHKHTHGPNAIQQQIHEPQSNNGGGWGGGGGGGGEEAWGGEGRGR